MAYPLRSEIPEKEVIVCSTSNESVSFWYQCFCKGRAVFLHLFSIVLLSLWDTRTKRIKCVPWIQEYWLLSKRQLLQQFDSREVLLGGQGIQRYLCFATTRINCNLNLLRRCSHTSMLIVSSPTFLVLRKNILKMSIQFTKCFFK